MCLPRNLHLMPGWSTSGQNMRLNVTNSLAIILCQTSYQILAMLSLWRHSEAQTFWPLTSWELWFTAGVNSADSMLRTCTFDPGDSSLRTVLQPVSSSRLSQKKQQPKSIYNPADLFSSPFFMNPYWYLALNRKYWHTTKLESFLT